MSGSLKLSQFRNTSTLNNDLVIGNPRVALSTDHDTRYLVFQTSDLVGPANNPYISCTHSGVNDWTIAIGDAIGVYNFAFVDKANIFTENNTFSAGKTVTFNGPIVSNNPITANGNVTLGDTNADTLDVHAVAHLFDNLTVDGNFTSSGTTTLLNTTNTNIKDLLITLNKGGAVASGGGSGFEVEENNIITGYVKMAPIGRDTLDITVPALPAAVVSLKPQATVLLTLPSSNGTLALLSDISLLWLPSGSDIYFTSGRVSIGGSSFTTGIQLLVSGGATVNYGGGAQTNNVAYGIALSVNTSGAANSAIGYHALNANITGNSNSALGSGALASNISGSFNTAFGTSALTGNTTSDQSTAVGYQALAANNATRNTAIGSHSLLVNTAGTDNTAVGADTLPSNTASLNTAIGASSMFTNTTGTRNTALGTLSLYTNLTTSDNTAMGYHALFSNTASNNTAIGSSALTANTTGAQNIAVSANALLKNTTGSNNIAIGFESLRENLSGDDNTAIGFDSLASNTIGTWNTAVGMASSSNNVIGVSNTSIGYAALQANTSNGNTAIGYNAAVALTGPTNCTFIGNAATADANTYSNSTALGYQALVTASNQIVFGNSSVTNIDGFGTLTTTKAIVAKGVFTYTPADTTTCTVDCSLGNCFIITLPAGGGTVTMAFSGMVIGQTINVIFNQGAAGTTVILPSTPTVKYANGNSTIDTTATSSAMMSMVTYDATHWFAALSNGFA